MPDFSQLLQRETGTGKLPVLLPKGLYPAQIKEWEVGNANQKQTPYIRFILTLTGYPDDLDPTFDTSEVDLSKRTMRKDFFMTEDAWHRLDKFIRECGMEVGNGVTYEETLPKLVGQDVLADVSTYLNQNTNESGNQVNRLIGLAGK